MKRKKYLFKFLVIGAISLMIIPVFPACLSEINNLKEKQISNSTTSDYYTNSIIWIIGKCDTVNGPLPWLFGLYIPIFKKSFRIKASGQENEFLNVLIRGNKFASYLDNENIIIDLTRATGILFYGGRSILVNGTTIFARCKADSIVVTSYD